MWDHRTFSKLYILFNFHVNCKASNIVFLYHRVAAFFLYLMQDQVLETPCRIRLNIFLIFNYFNAIYTFYNTFMRNVEKLLEHTFKICGVNTATFSKYVWNGWRFYLVIIFLFTNPTRQENLYLLTIKNKNTRKRF